MEKLFSIVLTVSLPLVLIGVAVQLLTTNTYMQISKDKYQSHQEVQWDYDYVSDRLMEYLNYRHDDLLIGENEHSDKVIFTEIEISHMHDVKNLFTITRVITIIALITTILSIAFLYKKNIKMLLTALSTFWILPLLTLGTIGVFAFLDFNTLFTVFHKIVFTNDNWNLNEDHVLIVMLPEQFWMNSALFIIVFVFLFMSLIYILNKFYLQKKLDC